MTFDFTTVCMPTANFSLQSSSAARRGAQKTLIVANIISGWCSIICGDTLDVASGNTAYAGDFVVCYGPVLFTPGTSEAVYEAEGLYLVGSAPAQFGENCNSPLVLPAANCHLARGLFRQLINMPKNFSNAELSATAYTLLCHLASADTKAGGIPPLVSAAIVEMQTHYAEVYGIEELADELQVSKGHLIRSFTNAIGMPPGRYLSGIRIQAAKRRLVEGTLSLEVIAGLCGFSSAGYLCKVFKANTGESPVAWQKRVLTNSEAPLQQDELDEQLFL